MKRSMQSDKISNSTFFIIFLAKPKRPTEKKEIKKKEPVKQQPAKQPTGATVVKKPGRLNFNDMRLIVHRLSDAEIQKWTNNAKKRTISVNSRDSSKSTATNKGKSKPVVDIDSSSDSDSAKSPPVKKSKPDTTSAKR